MKTVFLSIISCMFIACQSGQIDKFILGIFDNHVDKTETNVLSNTCSPNLSKGNTDQNRSYEKNKKNLLEVPSYNKDEIVLTRIAYTACYDKNNKIPKWVAWHLTSEHSSGEQKRLSNFIVDDDVPSPRAELIDYKGSGYDRGHMCPVGDNKWGLEPMRESFYLTNICPQNHNLNCGDWNELEIACREWANKYGDIYIVAGPILSKDVIETIGPNRVPVPDAFFKVILCMKDSPKGIGFIYKNRECNNPQSSYVKTIDEIEGITGIDFFSSLPDDIENGIEATASYNKW